MMVMLYLRSFLTMYVLVFELTTRACYNMVMRIPNNTFTFYLIVFKVNCRILLKNTVSLLQSLLHKCKPQDNVVFTCKWELIFSLAFRHTFSWWLQQGFLLAPSPTRNDQMKLWWVKVNLTCEVTEERIYVLIIKR